MSDVKASLRLKWNGPEVSSFMKKAARDSLNETTEQCVSLAKSLVRVDTGNLQKNIRRWPAQGRGSYIMAVWGVDGVEYAIWQEIGTSKMTAKPYLRPAADNEYPKLAERIARRVQGRG